VLAFALPTLLSLRAPSASSRGDEPQRRWTIYADEIHTSTGRTIANGMVFVNNGKISLVSPGREDAGEKELLKVHAVTAGLVDASARVDPELESVEQSDEISPGVRVADSIDPFSIEWDRQVRSGVTIVLANPLDLDVVGGLGIVVKTAGPEEEGPHRPRRRGPARSHTGSPATGTIRRSAVRPISPRRPTTRMGVVGSGAMRSRAASRAFRARFGRRRDLRVGGDLPRRSRPGRRRTSAPRCS
jgi:imidazolonepropionase-like amidohydrolase